MKKLYRRLAVTFAVSAVLSMLIFAVSLLFGKTENNSPLLVIDGAEEDPELLRHITELPKDRGIILRINGKFQSVVIRELDGVYLMAFSGLGRVAGDVFLTFFLDLIVVGVICGLTLLLVRQHLKNYEIQLIKARTERPYWTSWRR